MSVTVASVTDSEGSKMSARSGVFDSITTELCNASKVSAVITERCSCENSRGGIVKSTFEVLIAFVGSASVRR